MNFPVASQNSDMTSVPISISVPSHVAKDLNAINSITKEIERRVSNKNRESNEDFLYALDDCMANFPDIIRDIMISHDMGDEIIEAYCERQFAKKYPDNYKYMCNDEVPSWYELWCKYSFVEEYPEDFKSVYSTRPVKSWVKLWRCRRKLDRMMMGEVVYGDEARDIFEHMYNDEYKHTIEKTANVPKS